MVGCFTDAQNKKVSMEVAGSLDGSNQEMTMTSNDVSFVERRVGGKVYVKGTEAYWLRTEKAPTNVAGAFKNRWVEYPTKKPASDLGTSVGSRVRVLLSDASIARLAEVSPKPIETRLNGIAAYVLSEMAGGSGARILISQEDGRLLRVDGVDQACGSFAFDRWDSVAPVTAPKEYVPLPERP
jgi:hypothetical protein